MAKVLISLPDALFREADHLAKREHRSRSELFRDALRLVLEREGQERPSWSETLGVVRERVEGHWLGRGTPVTTLPGDRRIPFPNRAQSPNFLRYSHLPRTHSACPRGT